MKPEVEIIDPARAEELLGRMAPNRNTRPSKIERYANDMAEGRWLPTGEAIKVTPDGRVIDGEHRLRAIIKADVAIETLIVYGIEATHRVAMDTGATRTFADHLKFQGERECTNLAAAVLALWQRHTGNPRTRPDVSHQQLTEMLDDHPGIRHSVQATRPAHAALRVSHGLCAALHYDMTAIEPEDADDFWHRLATGTEMHERHPVLVLRKRLQENAMQLGKKLDKLMVHAYIVKSWNFYRDGKDVSFIRWTRGGANPEPFPELQ